MTLEVLRIIARGTAGYRGRKNLIWVSAAFPFVLVPEQAEDFDLFHSHAEEMRRTATVLADAQVAVYPVDARGLAGFQTISAADSGRGLAGQAVAGPEFGNAISVEMYDLNSSHGTMETLARDTGGKAYYNRNDIDTAVELAVGDGSTYYTLGYYPEKKDWDGKFRRLEVKVERSGVQIRHRRGYYAIDPTEQPKSDKAKDEKGKEDESKRKEQELLAALSDPLPAAVVTFLAHVSSPAPSARAQVKVEFLVDAKTLAFEETPEGRQFCSVDFLAAAFSPQGKVVNSLSQTVQAPLRPETYARVVQRGLPFQMQLDLEPGRYLLRLVVRDNRTGLLGTTDVPLEIKEP